MPDEEVWVMLDENGERVVTPCCGADWMRPILISALCEKCAKPHEAWPLGIRVGHPRDRAAS